MSGYAFLGMCVCVCGCVCVCVCAGLRVSAKREKEISVSQIGKWQISPKYHAKAKQQQQRC